MKAGRLPENHPLEQKAREELRQKKGVLLPERVKVAPQPGQARRWGQRSR